ncbi:uncharacterized protein LOC130135983 [Syzygium oleosum]|uniref:uncharacterized protein LOC130135983 n=1 Tax=Syzygium oleosum TaxID=219896 RepID=UPI0024BB8D8F|nr:uncharacterized protein LOC130135983 [Syzygium oleosum]
MLDFFDRRSPLIVIDHSPPAPSVVSSSCVSDATPTDDDEEEEHRSQEEVSSPCSWLTLHLFPTRTCNNIQESFSFSVLNNRGGDPRQDIDPAPLRGNKRETLESSTSEETPIIFAERERSSRRVIPNKNEWPVPRHKGEEKYYAGISTELVLYEDPWKIRKKLTESNLGHLLRLLLLRGSVKTHVLQWMGEEMVRWVESRDRMEVVVRDADTGDEHRLVFRYRASSRSYLLNGDRNKLFVKGRALKVRDEIGMFWDTVSRKFRFMVLREVARGTSNAAA